MQGGLAGLLDQLAAQGQAQQTAGKLANAYDVQQGIQPQPQLQGGVLSRLLGISSSVPQPVSLAAPAPAISPGPQAAPALPALAYAPTGGPSTGGGAMPAAAAPANPYGNQPDASAVPSLARQGAPSFAAAQGAPTGMGLNGLFSGIEQKFNLPPGYLAQTATIESHGDPNAVSPTGARGIFQFTKGTAKQYNLADPTNVVASTYAAGQLAADNANTLRNALGRDPTAGELYLAHQQGGGGAAKLLANPNARAGDIVGDQAVRVNGGDPNMTAGQFASIWTNRFNAAGGGGPSVQPQPNASPFGSLAGAGQNGSPQLPYLASSGITPSLTNATPLPNRGGPAPVGMARSASGQPVQTDAQGNALNPDGTPTSMNYAPSTGMVTAPAQQAIAAAAPGGDPLVTVPGYQGQWNKAKIAAAPDGTDVPDDGELAKAQAAGGSQAPAQAPPAAPATASAPMAYTPAQQDPSASAGVAPPSPGNQNTVKAIRMLLADPNTAQMGMKLWEQAATGKNYGFLQTSDGTIIRTDGINGTATPVYQGGKTFQHFAGKDGSEYAFDPRTAGITKLSDGGPGTTTVQPSDYAKYGIDPSYKGPVQIDSDGNLKFPAPAGSVVRPQLVDVPQGDGTVQKQWVTPGQVTGQPVGAAYSPAKNAGVMGPTEQKIFNDHYDKLEALGQGLQALKDARALSDQTPTGWAATGERAANYLSGGHAYSDQVSNADTYDAKIKLASTALMRAAIGGRVTNYDEKIAQDIAPTSAKSIDARNKILDDQIAQKERDYANAQATVEAMRNGTYFAKGPNAQKLQGQSPVAQTYIPATSVQDALSQARSAIAAGADPGAVRARLQQHGIDPAGL